MGLRVQLWGRGCTYGAERHLWGCGCSYGAVLIGLMGTYGAESAVMGQRVHLWG